MSDLAVVFQIGSLGDTIVSIPALRSIRAFLPGVSEYILVNRAEGSARVLPSQVFDMAWSPTQQLTYRGSPSKIRQACSAMPLAMKLRYYKPKYCVYLMPVDRSESQISRDKLFFKSAGVRELVGFRSLNRDELETTTPPTFRHSQAYLRFRRLWGDAADESYRSFCPTPVLQPRPSAREHVRQWLRQVRRYPTRRLIALSPYSNSTSKDLEHSTIVRLVPRLEIILNAEVVVVGAKKDAARCEAAATAAGTGLNACGLFTLEESAALLENCDLAVCVDSGPMHLAGALGVPLVVPFSRMNKELGRWFPLGDRHTILYRSVSCAGCRLTECNVPGHPCMRDISVDQIVNAAVAELSGGATKSEDIGDTHIFASSRDSLPQVTLGVARTLNQVVP